MLRCKLLLPVTAILLLVQVQAGCDACGSVIQAPLADGSTGPLDGQVSVLDGSVDRALLDGQSQSDGGDPLQQNLPTFCSGTGSVVSIGSSGICAGDLAADTFRFALCACQGIAVQGQLTVDAFDSSQGAYGGSNIIDDGQLGLNQGALALDNRLTVRGSVFSGGGGISFGPNSLVSQNLYAYGDFSLGGQGGSNASVGRNAFVNGNVSNRITIGGDLTVPASATVGATVTGTIIRAEVPQILPCPCAAEQILDIAALTTWAATHNDNDAYAVADAGATEDAGFRLDPALYESGGPTTLRLPCGRFYLTTVNQTGLALDIVVQDRAVLFINGDLSAQRFTIHIESGGELDLFVAGNLTIGAAADFGAPDKPSSVRTYVGGNLSFQASSSFAGNVYAPNADILFGAYADLYGSLMVRNVTFNAAGSVHYDSAIRRASESCDVVVGPDGGVVTVDAGPRVDAGPGGCTLCGSECGEQACLIAAGQTTGTCGACVTDLDCCAPLLCDSATGNCFLPGG